MLKWKKAIMEGAGIVHFGNLKSKTLEICNKIKDWLIATVVIIIFSVIVGKLFGFDNAGKMTTTLILLAGLISIFHKHSILNFNSGYKYHIKHEYDLSLEFYNKTQ